MTNKRKYKVALFPCKANPPHVGHIISLLRIKKDYDKIIIDILDKDQLIPVKKSISDLKEIFDNFPGKFDYSTHKISYTKTKSLDNVPKCDVIVTGNRKVARKFEKLGANVRVIDRVPVYRGRYIREAYIKGLKSSKKRSFSFEMMKKKLFIFRNRITKIN